MQCFENFGGGQMPQMTPPLVARLPRHFNYTNCSI